jgi:hypothetical protein
MSKLEYLARPLVAFDPSNKEHRKYWYQFLEYGGWGTCPVRFIVPEDHGWDLVTMIQRSLVQYYIDREFKQPTPKTKPGRKANNPTR